MTIGPREQVDLAAWDAWRAARSFAEIAKAHPELIGANELAEAGAAIAHLQDVLLLARKTAA